MPKLNELLKVKNETLTSADLYFYGDIVSDEWEAWTDEDKYPQYVRDFLNNVQGKSLNIYINSCGGALFAGMAIYNMLKRHQGYKTVYVDGMAASIASVIALAGDVVKIPSNAYMMIHNPIVSAYGLNSAALRKLADEVDVIGEGIVNVYRENLCDGVNIEDVKKMMDEETWLTGEQSEKLFKNVVAGEKVQLAACATSLSFAKMPEISQIINPAQAADNTVCQRQTEKLIRAYIKAI
ncbi:MAG: Clp protease ClpP [Oscillospiraceae bacterium]|nr:Clp protease ClpP [Oscillospiraceae bacterium]